MLLCLPDKVIIRYYVNVYWGDDDEDEGIECGRQERRGGTGEKELKYLAGAHAMHTGEDEGGVAGKFVT